MPLAMAGDGWFDDVRVIGRLTPAERADVLRALGDPAAPPAESATDEARPMLFGRPPRPYEHTSHAFGFIPAQAVAGGAGAGPVRILSASAVPADPSLRGRQVRVTLDRLAVADYPGSGEHHVLFNFSAQHGTGGGNAETVHFNHVYRVRAGQQAGVVGYTVFDGLNVGDAGLAFKCFTVNVKNRDDERALAFLEGGPFQAGLKLAAAANPVVPVVADLALGLTRMVLGRNRNVAVQDIYMGLDFSPVPTRARLAEGAYVAVQVPDAAAWDWNQWVFSVASGQIVSAAAPASGIPFNYLVFGVSRT